MNGQDHEDSTVEGVAASRSASHPPGMSDCCNIGFKWHGKPTGKEVTLGQNKAYVSGSNRHAAVLIVHDVFGWTLSNTRLLADHFAREANVTAYLPDFFDGEVVDPEELYSGKLPLMEFVGRNSKELRRPEILAAAKELKLKYNKVGAIGYCYGGWAVFQLGEKGNNLVDCISTAHPSLVEEREIEMLGVPIQILAPETDTQLTPELKEFCNRIIPTLGLGYVYEFFPGLSHGFATRGDPDIQVQKDGLERAKNSIVHWLQHNLHRTK